MNIMLTCAGRRDYLIHWFQMAFGSQGQVYAADSGLDAPALQEADKAFIVPDIHHPDYIDALLSICQEHRIRLLIPPHDLEWPLIAKRYDQFLKRGTFPVVSSPKVVEICFDKWAASKFLGGCGLAVPKTYLSLAEACEALSRGEITFPVVVKPRWGTTSIGIEYPEDEEELTLAYKMVKKRLSKSFLREISATDSERCILIQELLLGQEYGLDVINDFDYHYVHTFVRRKLRMRSGQTDRAITVKSYQIEKIGEEIGKNLRHLGNLDCDVFATEKGYYVLNMNPRIGAGYPFSHIAGANLPAMFVAWAEGKDPDASWFIVRPDVMIAKADKFVVVENRRTDEHREKGYE